MAVIKRFITLVYGGKLKYHSNLISTIVINLGILIIAYIGTAVNYNGIFIKLTPGAYVMKLLTAIIYGNDSPYINS